MDPPPPTAATKLRLMCSYGGHIIPRPQTKSLYYYGGENRIITIPTTANTATLSLLSFTAHLSNFLHLATPFIIKYQLPDHDLDSLVSISTDDDLQIMLEEHIRLCSSTSSATPSRIRLFLFPLVNGGNPELSHPKRESWFADSLRSAKVGFGGGESGEQAESIVLETSSYGSTASSSLSLSNMPPIKPSSDSIPSDDYVASAVSNVQTGICQDQVCLIPVVENKVSSNLFESDKKIVDPSSGVEMHKPMQTTGFPVNLMDLPQQQTQFVYEGTNYVPQNIPGIQAVQSYYPVYHSVSQQQHHHYLPPSQPYPLYYMPVAPAQSYNIPVQHGVVQASCIRSGPPQSLPNSSWMPTQVVLKEFAAVHQPVAELTSQQYTNIAAGHPGIHVPRSEAETILTGAQINNPPQPVGAATCEAENYTTKLDDDPVRVQIYKSQPPAPVLPSQYQTMTKATTLHLSEAMEKLQTDNGEQQIRTSEPQ